jgi:small-conductance mechanosensitive channel
MNQVMDSFDRLKVALFQILAILPRLALGMIILAAGFLVARTLERMTDGALERLHFDREAAKWGVTEAMERSGAGGPTQIMGKLLFWFVMLIIILLAASALGVSNIGDLFQSLVLYLPNVFAAVIVIILGIILGEFVRALILASAGGVEGVPLLSQVAKFVVVLVSVFMALQQVNVGADIVTTAFTLILGAAALAVALAFGLGNMALAGEVTRRWYERSRSRTGNRGRRSTDRTPPVEPPATTG